MAPGMDETVRASVRGIINHALAMNWGTRVLMCALLGFSALLALLRTVVMLFCGKEASAGALRFPYLVLVPGRSVFFPWTLLSSAFCETSVLEVRGRCCY